MTIVLTIIVAVAMLYIIIRSLQDEFDDEG